MAEVNLTQSEADALVGIEKHRIDDQPWNLPSVGGTIMIPLVSANKKEQFALDISRGRIDLAKGKYQNRGRQVVILRRLDFGGALHRNPDDEEIPCPHLHIYRESWGDKWAIPAPAEWFANPGDLWRVLEKFMWHCNITQPPIIVRGLFT